MNNRKNVIILLILLLVTVTIVLIQSTVDCSKTDDPMSDSLVNHTTAINGEKIPEIQWVNHQIDASKVNKRLTKDEFLSVNKEYIDYLEKTMGKEEADKYVNETISEMLADRSNIRDEQR